MKIRWVFAILLVFLTFGGPLYAGSVYFWTDENGVRHYSNTGLPDEVVEADVRPEETSPSQPAEESTVKEPDAGQEESADVDDPDNPPPGKGEPINDRLAAQAESERQRLESEIKKIKGLAIGKSFTQGMKDARIRPLQEQLSLLAADPKRYFRMKREGAFKSSYPDGSAENATSPSDPLSGSLSSEPATSSAGGSSGNDDTSQSETTEEKPSDEAPSNEKKSGKTRSSGSGTATLFPED